MRGTNYRVGDALRALRRAGFEVAQSNGHWKARHPDGRSFMVNRFNHGKLHRCTYMDLRKAGILE